MKTKFNSKLKLILVGMIIAGAAYGITTQVYCPAPDMGQPGGPVSGLSAKQLQKFYKAKEVFKRQFSPEEGLGPLFNGRSCFECHGQPGATGGEGRDVASTGVVRIGKRIGPKAAGPLRNVSAGLTLADVDLLINSGGPALERKSITSEFPDKYPQDCQVEIGTVPKEADILSMRHAGPLFGLGLIDAIPDDVLAQNMMREASKYPDLAGRLISHTDPLTGRAHIGRFGWKCQHARVMNFTAEAMNVEMGITTYLQPARKSASGLAQFPQCIYKYLGEGPDDKGTVTNQLTYFQSLLAPPPRGTITEQVTRGERLFTKLQCAGCHTPELSTGPLVYVVDPDSPAPRITHMEVAALESKPVRAYSDFLLHNMGPELADGLPQNGAIGGEWRTTPLWGLRFKKFYLHDGRTTDLNKAILVHGGQAKRVIEKYKTLPAKDQEDLLSFLRSL